MTLVFPKCLHRLLVQPSVGLWCLIWTRSFFSLIIYTTFLPLIQTLYKCGISTVLTTWYSLTAAFSFRLSSADTLSRISWSCSRILAPKVGTTLNLNMISSSERKRLPSQLSLILDITFCIQFRKYKQYSPFLCINWFAKRNSSRKSSLLSEIFLSKFRLCRVHNKIIIDYWYRIIPPVFKICG